MKKNQIVTAWTRFANQLVQGECPEAKVNCSEFGQLMANVVAKHGAAESVLWSEKTPVGTEDNTWVRTWLCTKGIPKYAFMVQETCLDRAHVVRCLQAFETVAE